MDKTLSQSESSFSFEEYFSHQQKEHFDNSVSAYDFVYHFHLLKEEHQAVSEMTIKAAKIEQTLFFTSIFVLFHVIYISASFICHQTINVQTYLPSAFFALIAGSFIKPHFSDFLSAIGLGSHTWLPGFKSKKRELEIDWEDHIQLLSNKDFQYQLLIFLDNRDLVDEKQFEALKVMLVEQKTEQALHFLLHLPLSITMDTRDKSMEKIYWNAGLKLTSQKLVK
jgi:hypothetical protein